MFLSPKIYHSTAFCLCPEFYKVVLLCEFSFYFQSGSHRGKLRNILIICTVVVFRQMNFIKTKKLGFDREHVVVIPIKEKETLSI